MPRRAREHIVHFTPKIWMIFGAQFLVFQNWKIENHESLHESTLIIKTDLVGFFCPVRDIR